MQKQAVNVDIYSGSLKYLHLSQRTLIFILCAVYKTSGNFVSTIMRSSYLYRQFESTYKSYRIFDINLYLI